MIEIKNVSKSYNKLQKSVDSLDFTIKNGENFLTFEVENNIEKGMFSYEFLTNGPCSDHYMFKIKNLKKD